MKDILQKICILTAAIMLSANVAEGQIQYDNIRFQHLDIDDGLPHNSIYAITSDKNGFLWFGTRNGLCRFDGYTIKTFLHDDSDRNTICHNFINRLYDDRERNLLWISTDKGISSYDYSAEDFNHYRIEGNIKDEVNFFNTSNNDFLAACSNGIFRYDRDEDIFTPYMTDEVGYYVNSLAEDSSKTLWIECAKGLLRYNLETKIFEPLPDEISAYAGKCSNITFVTPDQFLFNTSNGFYIYHIQSRTLRHLSKNLKVKVFRCASEDALGNIWVGTEYGIYVFNRKYQLTAHYEQTEEDLSALNDSPIYSLYLDENYNMWVGTYFGGVNYHVSGTDRFKVYPYGGGSNHLSGKAVRQIINSNDDGLYICTEDGGLNYMDGHKRITRSEYLHERMHIKAKNIHSLLLEKDNSLWLGLFMQGVLHHDLNNGYTTDYNHHEGEESSGFCMVKDDSGRLWYGGPAGLFTIDKGKQSAELVSPMRIFSMMVLNDSTIWAGTRKEGLLQIDTRHRKVSPLDILPDSALFISYLYQDSQENIWIGTDNRGVFVSDPHCNLIASYNSQDLASNAIKGIIEDDMQNIWISTGNGLCCINPKQSEIERYTTTDGLPVNQFNYNSACRKPDGELYFGTINGMVSFYPKLVNPTSPRFCVALTGIWSNNKEMSPNNEAAYIPSSISDLAEITLSYNQARSIRIEYSGVNYQFRDNTVYAMMMEGIDDDWQIVGNQHQVRFSNLHPGRYVLRIKGSKNGVDWDETGQKNVKIRILPPWWMSNTAIMMYVIILILICLASYRYAKMRIILQMRLKAEHEQRMNVEALNRQKINFFTYVSHDLKTPLTLILSPLKRLIQQDNLTNGDKDRLEVIYRNANRMNYLINELLTFSKIEMKQTNITVRKGDIMLFIEDLAEIFKETADDREIDFIMELEDNTQPVWFSPSNVERILYNLLSNAFKYTPSGGLVHLKSEFVTENGETFVRISVKDNGKGIPEEFQEAIFESYYQLDKSCYREGFGLGLALTRSLIHLHKGNISVSSEVGKGSVFIVNLNVSESAYSQEEKTSETLNPEDIRKYNQRLKDTIELVPEQHEISDESNRRETIMIVEDNIEMNDYIADIFKDNYDIIQAYNGQEAIEKLDKLLPDLIISDLMMPVMDGLTFTGYIKNSINTCHIPVILLTAKSEEQDITEGYMHGADAYLTKPFNANNLELLIHNIQQNRKMSFQYFKQSEKLNIRQLTKNPKDEAFVQKLIDLIMANIDKENFSVSEITEHMSVSRSLLHTKIKTLTGSSVTRFIRTIKMREAKNHMLNGKNVSEASYAVGIYDPNYFTKCFKKEFGMTPSEFLKQS